MVAKIRNQYVRSGYYDAYFVELMKRLRCIDDPRYFECPRVDKIKGNLSCLYFA